MQSCHGCFFYSWTLRVSCSEVNYKGFRPVAVGVNHFSSQASIFFNNNKKRCRFWKYRNTREIKIKMIIQAWYIWYFLIFFGLLFFLFKKVSLEKIRGGHDLNLDLLIQESEYIFSHSWNFWASIFSKFLQGEK